MLHHFLPIYVFQYCVFVSLHFNQLLDKGDTWLKRDNHPLVRSGQVVIRNGSLLPFDRYYLPV